LLLVLYQIIARVHLFLVFELNKVAKVLKVSTDYLLGNTDVKIPSATIQAINKMTGLNENTVNTLKETKNINSLHTRLNISFINYLISNGWMWKITNCMWESMADLKMKKDYAQHILLLILI
jgi:hypothetical protein